MIEYPELRFPPINLTVMGSAMTNETRNDIENDENMGDDFGRLPNEWYKQSQKDPRFRIKDALERLREEQEKYINRFELSM